MNTIKKAMKHLLPTLAIMLLGAAIMGAFVLTDIFLMGGS